MLGNTLLSLKKCKFLKRYSILCDVQVKNKCLSSDQDGKQHIPKKMQSQKSKHDVYCWYLQTWI